MQLATVEKTLREAAANRDQISKRRQELEARRDKLQAEAECHRATLARFEDAKQRGLTDLALIDAAAEARDALPRIEAELASIAEHDDALRRAQHPFTQEVIYSRQSWIERRLAETEAAITKHVAGDKRLISLLVEAEALRAVRGGGLFAVRKPVTDADPLPVTIEAPMRDHVRAIEKRTESLMGELKRLGAT